MNARIIAVFTVIVEQGAAMLGRRTSARSARLAVGFAAAASTLILSLATSGVARADSNFPSQHWAGATCYRTSVTNTWTVMSNVYMNRADGYGAASFATGGGTTTGGAWYTSINGMSYGQQWLYYQVVVVTWNSRAAKYDYTYGTWIRGLDHLGDGTSGLDSEVWDQATGRWVRTGYTGAGSPWDVSYANGFIGGIALQGSGKKYVYAHYFWGSILDGNNAVAFPSYDVYEPLGWMTCY